MKQCQWPECQRITRGKWCKEHAKAAKSERKRNYDRSHRARERARYLRRMKGEVDPATFNDANPELDPLYRGVPIVVEGWTISPMIYGVLVDKFGINGAKAHCAWLAKRGRAA